MLVLVGILLAALTLWAAAALAIDLHPSASAAYLLLLVFLFWRLRPYPRALAAGFAAFLLVLLWWINLKPSNQRNWQPDVARTAFAERTGNIVTIHNVRNADYRSETDYDVRWETRQIDLDTIHGADIAITWWGSPYIAHPIVSFHYGDGRYLALSIEVRKEVGEGYSAVRGFFRQFELMVLAADERDVIRLRTNYRQGEEVYLYHLNLTPEQARSAFLSYLDRMNAMHRQPEWYNALTTNCTTEIRTLADASLGRTSPWDWRILANGKLDELLYERGRIAGSLPFPELKARAHINQIARAADQSPNFSAAIRPR